MRRILLTLAEDTTATHCGGCDYRRPAIDAQWCGAFRSWMRGYGWEPVHRLPDCLAAEAAAARMVEIAPEDAAMDSASLSYPVDREHDARVRDAWNRIETALRAHAAKAEVKR